MNDQLRILVSYPYLNARFIKRMSECWSELDFFLDCGAFTAWKGGKTITLDEYCSFVESLPFTPPRYMALDVVGDPEATLENYEAMRRRGLDPVPVLTRGETTEALDRYFQTSKLVALGGIAGADAASYAWTAKMVQHAAGRHTHVLGFTSLDWIKHLRPWSCDSSSWLSAARYGSMIVYLGHGRMKVVKPRELSKLEPRIAERVRRYGFDPYEVGKKHAGVGNNSLWQTISTYSWLEYAMDQERQIGVRMYLAMTTEHWFDHLLRCYHAVQEARAKRAA